MTRDEIAAKYGVTTPPQATGKPSVNTAEAIAAKYHSVEDTPPPSDTPEGKDTSN